MSGQRLDEWLNLSESDRQYHFLQWRSPKKSTIAFAEFLRDKIEQSKLVADIGCGGGGATYYFAKTFPTNRFLGIDIVPSLIEFANESCNKAKIENLSFDVGDGFALSKRDNVDGAISIHTLMDLPNWQQAIDEVVLKLAPKWIGISSLFYEGDITASTEIIEHARGRKVIYNTYALPDVARYVDSRGMKLTRYKGFDIDIDLPRGSPDAMGSYTVKRAEGGARLQISGPLLMNWGFVLIENPTTSAG